MKKQLLLIAMLFATIAAFSQVGIGTKNPSPVSALDIKGGYSKGLIVPIVDSIKSVDLNVLTTAEDTARAAGLMVYQSSDSLFYFWNTKEWQCINPFATDNITKNITPKAPYETISGNFEGEFEGEFEGNVSGQLEASGDNVFSGNGTIPIGGIIMWSGTEIPDGWDLCDGNNGTPDLRGRFVRGYHPYTHGMGTKGGNASITILNKHLPPHQHQMSSDGADVSITGGSHTHEVADRSENTGGDNRVISRGENYDGTIDDYFAHANTHTHNTSEFSGNTGTGVNCNSNSISILPPYYVLAFIMRTD